MKIKKIGLRRKTTTLLWTLLIGSVIFGIYKNFTAIDQHTTHEEKIIKEEIVDTNFISSYVTNFVKEYYSWEPKKEALEKRTERLKYYFPENLQQINQEMIRSDIPTRSQVVNTQIWQIKKIDRNDYKVTYSLSQLIEESKGEKTEKRQVNSCFSMKVRADQRHRMVILENPVMAALPKKLEIKTAPLQDDLAVSQKEKTEVKRFLETFFKVYPTAKKTELLYYVDDPDVEEVTDDYLFSAIQSINYYATKKGVKVKATVMYLNPETKANYFFDYEMKLEKIKNNWIIKGGI